MRKPKIDGAPGLVWRTRADGFVATWIARRDLIKRGFTPRTQRLWPPAHGPHGADPTETEVAYIRSECIRLQDEMLAFSRNGDKAAAVFTPTWNGLINAYQNDPDSPYNRKIRFESRGTYIAHMRAISHNVGVKALKETKGRDFLRWYENWSEYGAHVPRAAARMTMIRMLLAFGVSIIEDGECARLATILGNMKFAQGRARSEEVNAEQATAIRRRAHELGLHSIALGQAFQFETTLRQRDVIGQWTPQGEPGMSDVTWRGKKWLFGIDWRNVSPDLILTHRLSKSLQGRNAIMDPRAGKVKRFDLNLYPMIVEDLAFIPAAARAGPIIVEERTGRPYTRQRYREVWRSIADEVGVPRSVQNRDSRAGGATEGIDAMDGDLEAVRHAMGHSDISTTQIYSRRADQQTAKVAQFRAQKRTSNKTANGENGK